MHRIHEKCNFLKLLMKSCSCCSFGAGLAGTPGLLVAFFKAGSGSIGFCYNMHFLLKYL